MERNEIIRRLLLNPLDWITLTPLLIGAAVGLGGWAVKLESGIAVAAFVILSLISAGIYLHRLLFGWSEQSQRIVEQWRIDVERARDNELDRLYRGLKQDGDPRTEALLQDLRTLTKALMSEQSETLTLSAFDIVADVDKLFQRSVAYLQESLELWQTAAQVHKESIKQQLLSQREVLITEVEKSLDNLGNVLGSLKRTAVNSADGQQLAELREELTARLRLAEEVEQRMQALRTGNVADGDQTYLKYADN